MPGLFDTPSLGPDTVVPFPHQEAAIAAAREALREHQGTLIVHATGTGKGTTIAKIGRMSVEMGRKVLVLTHTDELVKDLAGRFDLVGIEPGVEQGPQFARRWFEPQVTVGSVATMKNTERLLGFPEDYFQLIEVDEAHHASSPSYVKIISRFPKAKRVGFTATPRRADGLSINGMFPSVAHTFSILDAWDAERETGVQYLCDLVPVRLDIDIDLRKLKPGKQDFSDADLDERVAPMIEMICNKSAEKIGDRQTIAFFPSVRSSVLYAKGMRDLGFRAEAVWGEDPEREQKVAAYQKGELQILANCQLVTEGFDVPSTSAVLLARPTKSWTLYLQMIGRGSRRGKPNCILIDMNYITDEFGLVQPTDLIDVPGFDREIAAMAAELVRKTPGLSLRDAIEEAREEQASRKFRQQFAIRMSISERKIECPEETFSMKAAHHDGETFTGRVTAASADFQRPTPKQIAYLIGKGHKDAAGWSKGRAGDQIGRYERQRREGLSDNWQVGKLVKQGVDAAEAREMTVAAAEAVIDGYGDRRRQIYRGR